MQPGDAGELSGPMQVGLLSAKARLTAQGSCEALYGSLCHAFGSRWSKRRSAGTAWELAASGWSSSSWQSIPRRTSCNASTTVDDPLNNTAAFLRFRTRQEWLPYRPPCGPPPRSPGKHSNRGRFQMSQLRARGSPFFGSRVEGQSEIASMDELTS